MSSCYSGVDGNFNNSANILRHNHNFSLHSIGMSVPEEIILEQQRQVRLARLWLGYCAGQHNQRHNSISKRRSCLLVSATTLAWLAAWQPPLASTHQTPTSRCVTGEWPGMSQSVEGGSGQRSGQDTPPWTPLAGPAEPDCSMQHCSNKSQIPTETLPTASNPCH